MIFIRGVITIYGEISLINMISATIIASAPILLKIFPSKAFCMSKPLVLSFGTFSCVSIIDSCITGSGLGVISGSIAGCCESSG